MIEQLLKEAKNLEFINPEIGPKNPILPSDKVIGEVPDNLKRLYFLTRKYTSKIHKILRTQEPTDENHQKVHRLQDIISLLTNLFWISIKEEFSQYNTWDCSTSLSLREGWKVVILQDDEDDEDENSMGKLSDLVKIFQDFAEGLTDTINEHAKAHYPDNDDDLNDAIDEFVKRS